MMVVLASAPQIDNEVYEFLPCGICETNIFYFWKIPLGSVNIYPLDIWRLKYAYAYFAANHKDIYIYIYRSLSSKVFLKNSDPGEFGV